MTEEKNITQEDSRVVDEKESTTQKQRTKSEIILLITLIIFIAFNAYMFFTASYAIVRETYDSQTVIDISYREIFKQTEGFSTQLATYMETKDATESLFYEKLSILFLWAGCASTIVGTIQLIKEKRKLNFLIVGIMLLCIGSSGLFIAFNLIKHTFNSRTGDFGILGAVVKNMLSIKSDTFKHFFLNLVIAFIAVCEIEKLKNIYTNIGEEKNEQTEQINTAECQP